MTYTEMEGFVDYCLNKGLKANELKDLAKRMAIFDSVNFINILKKQGIEISV